MSTMPRPVLPEPVMPTITPWVVKSAVSSVTRRAAALVRGRVDELAESEVCHGSERSPGRPA